VAHKATDASAGGTAARKVSAEPRFVMHFVRRRNMFRCMTNRFGFDLHPKEVRWAAAEGVSEDVIAAVLLLHERSVDEMAPKLSALELEQVIKLVGRSPRLYPPGILNALNQRRTSPSLQPPSDKGSTEAGKSTGRASDTDHPRSHQTPPHSEHGTGADAGASSPRSAEGKPQKTGT
jgi:hypothetical protein